jgi:hypothetical protein
VLRGRVEPGTGTGTGTGTGSARRQWQWVGVGVVTAALRTRDKDRGAAVVEGMLAGLDASNGRRRWGPPSKLKSKRIMHNLVPVVLKHSQGCFLHYPTSPG